MSNKYTEDDHHLAFRLQLRSSNPHPCLRSEVAQSGGARHAAFHLHGLNSIAGGHVCVGGFRGGGKGAARGTLVGVTQDARVTQEGADTFFLPQHFLE